MYPNTPSYLLQMPGYPNWYFDTRTGQNVQLAPMVVQQMHWHEQQENHLAQAHARAVMNNVQQFGHVGVGVWRNGSQLWGNGAGQSGHYRAGSRQEAVWAVQQNAQFGNGGYNAPVMQPVRQAQLQPLPTVIAVPSPASVSQIPAGRQQDAGLVPASNAVIDLTGDEAAGAAIPAPNLTKSSTSPQTAAAEGQAASNVELAPAPTDPSAWKRGKRHLDKKLTAGSDSSRLFESMKTKLAPLQRNVEWDNVAALPILEDPSDELRLEREQFLHDIEDEKAHLRQGLCGKRSAKVSQEESGQWSNMVSNMKGPVFLERFGRKKTADAVRDVVRERGEELARGDLALKGVSNKRKLAAAEQKRSSKKIKTKAAPQSEAVPFAAPTPAGSPASEPTQDTEEKLDAEGDADDGGQIEEEGDTFMQYLLDQFEEEKPTADGAASPGVEVLEEPTNAPLSLSPPLSPTSLFSPSALEMEEDKGNFPQERILEQVTAPSPTISSPREESTVASDTIFSEQDTAPTSPVVAPQEENTVVIAEEDDLDDLFVDKEIFSENTVVPAEEDDIDDLDDLFTDKETFSEQDPAPPADPPQEENTAGKPEAPATADWELVEAGIHYTAILAKKQSEITELEQSISNGLTHRNQFFKAKMEKLRPAKETALRVLKGEYEVLELLSREEVFRMWEEANPVAIECRRQCEAEKAMKSAPKKKEAGSCGRSKGKW
ncbi:hypothetical protein EKO04_008996 [Ascochyta lentis]|uniref:Uncharacterized protein n=1 Tax=Ascochyta lentis TaxID=205686 RepID=A0A8H7IUL3_9PLEO|nr:hypothetical protein EKO04_008996 [Ascochyta lentis]